MVDAGVLLSGARVWKVSVIPSEIRSRAKLSCALPSFLDPSTRYRAQIPWVQVDYVRVVDLDIGASKSDKVVTEVTPAGDFWERSLNIRIILNAIGPLHLHFVRPGWMLPKQATVKT
jgi:hypothetical protein